jgi:hypothetical protein
MDRGRREMGAPSTRLHVGVLEDIVYKRIAFVLVWTGRLATFVIVTGVVVQPISIV